ncbi:MAG TPA: hypothetical protein PLC28_13800 [Spirochaetota bacterium]|nr:hypothetical protein [Spirochaetota bacterium]HPC42137.1 hypothetical protein [Spirochaetota bacterium]HPL18615.1 hypothetical protein [Spirochaetota bacterium]HQJ72192.1 hypothetical protein [Spirochaetota bacterium]HRS78478.1 hypothetical protein [Spirochaetota bacterium]
MIQTVLVIIIVSLSVAAAAVKLYRFLNPSPTMNTCSPDACAACPYRRDMTCSEKIKKN